MGMYSFTLSLRDANMIGFEGLDPRGVASLPNVFSSQPWWEVQIFSRGANLLRTLILELLLEFYLQINVFGWVGDATLRIGPN